MIPATGDYALRVAAYLAAQGGESRTSRDIAEATGVPSGYLNRVMTGLGRAGIVHSQRGLHGGYRLTAHPSQLTAQQVVTAVQPAARRSRSQPQDQPAVDEIMMAVARLLDRIDASADQLLASTTLEELAGQRGRAAG